MNYSSAVFLINDDVRAVKVSYEPEKGRDQYVFKTFDPNIKKGDYVVVPTDTRHGMTVVRVEEVDVDIDFDSNVQLKWIIGCVTKANYEHILQQEENAIEQIKSAEKRRKRDELRKAMLAYQVASIQALPPATVVDTTTTP